jgi:peptidoglycan/xylan/chitin deacetylase (PgdA/CDA1 family)
MTGGARSQAGASLKYAMKSLLYRIPGSSALSRIAARANRGAPVVLAFHGVTSEAPGNLCNYQGKHLYLPIFERFMEHLRERYAPVRLSRIAHWLEGKTVLPEGAVAVTFDDGYRNVLTNAVPVLNRLEIPASVYVVSDFVKEGKMVWTDAIVSALSATKKTRLELAHAERVIDLPIGDDAEKAAADSELRALCKSLADSERVDLVAKIVAALGVGERELAGAWPDHDPLRAEDLKTLVERGIEVGSHTKGHKILTRCTPEETRRELEESKSFIEGATGKPCDEFSYPNGGRGDFDARTGEAARKAGYRLAVTTIPMRVARGRNQFEIPRYTLADNRTSMAEFAAELSGYPGYVRAIKRRLAGPRDPIRESR